MDIVTQSLLGGVLAQTIANKKEKKVATVVGMISGLLADADFLIRSSNDPLLNIEIHRHFTHSLLFIPVGAAIAMLLLWPFMRKQLTAGRLYGFCFLGYSMSGILDAFTSYGTHLFWPFSDERVAMNIISIVDPVFSLILLTTLILGLRIKLKRIAYSGLVLCAVYLGLGFVQNQRASAVANELATSRGHSATQHVVKPTLGNLILWRSVYIDQNKIYVDAVRVGIFDDHQVFEGNSVGRFSINKDVPSLSETSVLYKDIQRFMTFSDGFVAFDPVRENVLGDLRYSMLPVSVSPLWGITINTAEPNRHADYRFYRVNDKNVRETFMNMLLGRCAKVVCE